MKGKTKISLPGSLRFRLMLPAIVFILIFSIFFIILNNHYTSKLLDNRLEREAVRISKIIYESRFILNPVYLKRLGEVIEGRIAIFDSSEKILAASFDLTKTDDFLFYVNPSNVRMKHTQDNLEQIVLKINKTNKSFLLVSRKLFFSNIKESILIAILTPLDDLQTAKYQAALRTILSGSFALLIAFIVASLILKKISTSVENILVVTDKIAAGNFNCKADLSDITEIKTLAVSINQMSDKLIAYEKQLVDSTRFVSANKITAAMAHEIKNPLSSMKMLAQIIQKRFKNDKEGVEMTAAVIREINRVDNLVSDLRTLTIPAKFSFSMINPILPLEEVITVIRPKLDHLNICFTSQIEPHLPEILMDKDKIKQVLWNLILNGAQSMPQGGILEIILEKNKTDDSIEYRIIDKGSGIDPKDMASIFTPFFTTRKEGIGIGLHVCKEIATAHKGEIKILPTNQGTTAILIIPFYREKITGAI